MSRTTTCILVSALIATLALPAVAQDWAGKGRANGVIKNEAGEPIVGAKVKLLKAGTGPEAIITNKKGRWSYLGLAHGGWQVLVEAEGYNTSEGSISVDEFGAAPLLEIVLRRNPYASIDKGDSLLDSGSYVEARAEYEKALQGLEPGPAARLRSRIGDTYYQEGDYEAARREYQAALAQLAPEEQAQVRLQLGNSYQLQENFAAARAEFEKVVPLLGPEGQAQVLLSIARGYDLENNRAQAIATLEQALELAPGDVQLVQLIADLLTREGREVEAREYIAQLPEDAEIPTDMVLNIGIRLYNDGDTEQAFEYFDRAVRENPDLAETYYYRGLIYLSRSENDSAKADFKKLLELEPGNARAGEVQEFLSFLEAE